MVTTTEWISRQNNPQNITGIATIDNGETATLPIPCHGRAVVNIGIPSAFTGTTVTFTRQAFPPSDPAAPTLDPPFRPVRDGAGNLVTYTVGTNRIIEVSELTGAYAFTIVSGSAEGGARQIEVQCVGPYPTSPGLNNVTVEGGSVAVTSVVPGTGATNLGKAEDAVHISGDVGVMALGVRNDGITDGAGTVGDYQFIGMANGGQVFVTGGVGLDAAIASSTTGGPVLGGGRASTATPSAVSADGDAVWAWMTRLGSLSTMPTTSTGVEYKVATTDGSNYGTAGIPTAAVTGWSGSAYQSVGALGVAASADGTTASGLNNGLLVAAVPFLASGLTVARQRGNEQSTLAASAARTSTLTVADQTNYNGAMLHAVIVVTVMASGGLTPVINGKGNLGTYYALLTGAKIVGAGTTVLRIGPGFATAVNAAAADMLPRTWNMVVTPDDATSITYSIEGNVNE